MKKYRKEELLLFSNAILFLITILVVIKIFNKPIRTYNITTATLIIDNNYVIFVNDKDMKYLQKNPYVYIDSKKVHIKIIEINKKYYKNFNKILIRIEKKKLKKQISISIYNNKKNFLELFFNCWEEDKWKN